MTYPLIAIGPIAVFIIQIVYQLLVKNDMRKLKTALYPGLVFIAVWAVFYYFLLKQRLAPANLRRDPIPCGESSSIWLVIITDVNPRCRAMGPTLAPQKRSRLQSVIPQTKRRSDNIEQRDFHDKALAYRKIILNRGQYCDHCCVARTMDLPAGPPPWRPGKEVHTYLFISCRGRKPGISH